MGKASKVWLTVGTVLIILGLVLFVAAMSVNQWDFGSLNTATFENNVHSVSEDFSSLSVLTDTADIFFLPSEDEVCSVHCYEMAQAKHTVAAENGVLTISIASDRRWYEYIGFHLETPTVTVYLPRSEYDMLTMKNSTGDVEIPQDFTFSSIDISTSTGDIKSCASVYGRLKINSSTGDIQLEDLSADSMDLSVSTGAITIRSVVCVGEVRIDVSTGAVRLTDMTCGSLVSDGSTGDLYLEQVIADKHFAIERSTGDIDFDRCDAGEIYVKTSTGSVEGGILSDKVFTVQSNTGDIEVPKTVSGGKCEITTDTGDIEIEIN